MCDKKPQEVLDFFKLTWCVDGEVRLATKEESIGARNRVKVWVRLQDSKRGIFYIAVTE